MVNCKDYENHYMLQAGGEIPYFSGPRYQKGYGLGSIFSGLLRSIIPIFKSSAAKNLGKIALKTGARVAGDILQGENLSNSLKNRAGEAIGNFTNHLNNKPSTDNQFSRPVSVARQRHRKKSLSRKKKKRSLDIFD